MKKILIITGAILFGLIILSLAIGKEGQVFLLIGKIVAFVASLALIVAEDYSAEKDKVDMTRKRFTFWKQYWPLRNDNISVLLLKSGITGFIGFYGSSELLQYFFPAFADVPVGDGAVEIILIVVFTLGAGQIIKRIKG